jgi:radical SAM protein with 4Fe4S-binding SPASM domain
MDLLSRRLLHVPVLGSFYARNAATIKRDVCLVLDRLGKLKPLTFVQWLATSGCNFQCPFCEASAGAPLPNELTTDEVRDLIDDLAAMGAKRFVVSGGEPLVRRDVVELMGHATEQGLDVGLVSNGFLVEERWEELGKLRFFLYFTSIDGPPEIHDRARGPQGAFDNALSGLRRFAEIGTPNRLVNTVVHPGNLHLLAELRDIVRESAATRWHLTPAAKVGRAAATDDYTLNGNQLRKVVEFVRESRSVIDVDLGEAHTYLGCLDGFPPGKPFFCGAGLTRCSIMADGSVLACHQVYDTRFAEGNIRERPFSEIWRQGFRELRQRRPPDECGGCVHLAACQGGCWADRKLHGGCLKPLWDGADDGFSADEPHSD